MARLETTDEHEEGDIEAGHATELPPPATTTKASRRTRRKRKRSGWFRFACIVVVACFGVAVILVAVFGVLYLALDPKMPVYTVDAVNVTAFGMDDDLTARARFDATVRFENPNRAIGISYEEGSSLALNYGEHRLSEGALPAFYQGHHDAAVVHVPMSEARLRGTGVVKAMQHINDGAGELPLVFSGEVPVRVKVGPVTTWKLTPRVKCDLVLNRLSTEGRIGVKNVSCKFSNMKLC